MEDKCNIDKSKYQTKNYIHIDKKVKFAKVESYVCNPDMIAKHSFLPLIHYTIETQKYIKSDDSKGFDLKFKKRDIRYAGHLDSFIYKYYGDLLNCSYNSYCESNDIDDCSTAYRNNKKGKSNIDFAAEVIKSIKEYDNAYIFIGDFQSFFDNLNHKKIKQRMKNILNADKLGNDWYNIYKSVTRYGSIDNKILENLPHIKNKLDISSYFSSVLKFRKTMKKSKNKGEGIAIDSNRTGKGIPQGTPISAVIANVYAIEFDKSMNELANEYHGIYRRYSDDFILIMPTNSNLSTKIEEISHFIKRFSIENDMELEESKSKILKYEDDIITNYKSNQLEKLDYLGFVFDGKVVKMRDKSISKFYIKAYKLIKHAKKVKEKKELTSLPYRRSIYNLYTDMGNDLKKSNFISYAKRAQEKFDKLSSETDNQMMKQMRNRKLHK